jgi:zinc transporter ZupT
MDKRSLAGSWFWWLKLLVIGGVSLLLLLLGINTLLSAYLLKNPLEFIMLFFSASFMILLGLTGLIYPAFRIHTAMKDDGKT